MIDYLGLMKHMPEILAVTAILGLLFGIPTLLREKKERDKNVRS